MWKRLFLPILGGVCLAAAVLHAVRAQAPRPGVAPPVEPGRTPWGCNLVGTGLVEAQTENIAIGSPLSGVVASVSVQTGQEVRAGEELFRLDDRALQAERKVRAAKLAAAEAQLHQMECLPRPEAIPPSEARIREAQAHLALQTDRLMRSRQVPIGQAVSEQEVTENEHAVRAAREQLARVRAEHDLLRAGASDAEKAVARAAVEQAQVELDQTQTELDRLRIRAPVDGKVLRVNVRPGEYVGDAPGQTLILFGSVATLHVRVDIDEHDIPRFHPGAAAWASLRGHPDPSYPLNFVRVEPYVVPKRDLGGGSREKVDTRVLQVLYAVASSPAPLYVGQQVEVFIETEEPFEATSPRSVQP